MSERTFRAVVAAVLIGALLLAAIIAAAVLRSPAPTPGPTATSTAAATSAASPTETPTAAPTPTSTPAVVFGEVGVTGVGTIPRGGESGPGLVLRFTEPAVDAIPDAPGSFTITLADAAGTAGTVAFAGTPKLDAPGSLGVTAEVIAPGVMRVSIVASDRFNIEPITLTGLAISATPDAALGPVGATLGDFTGSLAGGVANATLPSPGTVVAAP